MIPIYINITANVNNLSLSEIYEVLKKFSLERVKDSHTLVFKGFTFKIEVEVDSSIKYTITEEL